MLGYEAVGRAPDEFAARIKTEIPKWKKVIRAANIQLNRDWWFLQRINPFGLH